ncbi:hypothetical protein [Streptomyces anulatus]|uniref:hypothetical protein n=1 Tax=Streptomyces anulatus TaxID=1892 RepID=UPI001D189892|nr:hypothetical protein [Streptomyces anulatus]
MNAKRINAAAGVILAAQKQRQTPAGIAAALEAAGLLQSPESAAELAQLQDDITGACLARYEEEQDAKRARFAAKLARKRAFDLRAERDAFADWANTLAYAVAPVEVLGRYGEEGKYPWGDALELITPAAEVAALRARVAELEAARTTAAADRDQQIIAWLEKKAREEGTSNKDSRVRTTATYRLADKLSRGAVRPACPPVSPEDPHDSPLHHSYALGRDLPEVTPEPPAAKCRCGEPGADPYECEADDCTAEFSELNPFGSGARPVNVASAEVSRKCGTCGWTTSVWHVDDGSAEAELHDHTTRAHQQAVTS